MNINLRSDAKSITRYIKQRLADYPVYLNSGPGEDEDPIKRLILGYQIHQEAWVAVVFDTRRVGRCDGEWQSWVEDNRIELPGWSEAVDAFVYNDAAIQVTLPDGTKRKLDDIHDLHLLLRDMLTDILTDVENSRAFGKLPLARGFRMAVDIADAADYFIVEQLRATKALVKFCELHRRRNVGDVRKCLTALEQGDLRGAVTAWQKVRLGGNGCFDDWFPPVVFEHEDGEYVWAVFEALTAQWSRRMSLSA